MYLSTAIFVTFQTEPIRNPLILSVTAKGEWQAIILQMVRENERMLKKKHLGEALREVCRAIYESGEIEALPTKEQPNFRKRIISIHSSGRFFGEEKRLDFGVWSGQTSASRLLRMGETERIDGYTDFIFINRFGGVQHQGTLNKAIRRITRECNEKQLNSNSNPDVLLPRFSYHSLRHTFTTRLVEQGVNVKVVQDVLGHKDVKTTLNIYTDATQELKQREFEALQKKMTNRGDGQDKSEKVVKTSENQV